MIYLGEINRWLNFPSISLPIFHSADGADELK